MSYEVCVWRILFLVLGGFFYGGLWEVSLCCVFVVGVCEVVVFGFYCVFDGCEGLYWVFLLVRGSRVFCYDGD